MITPFLKVARGFLRPELASMAEAMEIEKPGRTFSPAAQGGIPVALFLIPVVMGSSHPASGALDVLQMKVKGVFTFLATGTHSSVPALDLQMVAHIYKRNSEGICVKTLGRTWKKLMLASSLLPLGTPLTSASSPGTLTSKLSWHLAAVGAILVPGHFRPGTFTNQIQAAFRELWFLVVADPRIDHQSLTEATYATFLPSFYVTQILFCMTGTLPSYATTTGNLPRGSVVDAYLGRSEHV